MSGVFHPGATPSAYGKGSRRLARLILTAVAFVLHLPAPSQADPVADFYRGKQISLYVAFPPGGGYDIYARVMLPYFQRKIPGNPTIVIRNMEGGGGVRAASFMTSVTPQDGLSLGLFLDSLTLGRVMGGPGSSIRSGSTGSAA